MKTSSTTATVIANDSSVKVVINLTISGPKVQQLEPFELQRFKQLLAREIATALQRLPFSDFGIENTRVVL